MSQKTFPDSTDNRQLSITGTDPFKTAFFILGMNWNMGNKLTGNMGNTFHT